MPRHVPPPKYDYSAIDDNTRKAFNQVAKQRLNLQDATPPAIASGSHWDIYTDGSGSGGRCSSVTPAGWGIHIEDQDEWTAEACGPVEIDEYSAFYLGATVGSNNTGGAYGMDGGRTVCTCIKYTAVPNHFSL